MRIVLVAESLETGGAESQLVCLAIELQRLGHLPIVVTLRGRGGVLSDRVTESGIELFSLNLKGTHFRRAINRLNRILGDFRPDVVYAFLLKPSMLVAFSKKTDSCMRIVWGIRDSFGKSGDFSLKGRVALGLARSLSTRADLIIANSHAGARSYSSLGFDMSVCEVIPNGIDTKKYRPDPEAGRRFALAHGLRPNHPVIGMMARYHKMKGHADFLHMAALLSKGSCHLHFVVVGRMSRLRRKCLARLARKLGIENFTTFIDQVDSSVEPLNAMAVCVVPSRFGEGFSNVVAEAMAIGTPIVATRVGDNEQLISAHGWLVEPRDPVGLARAVGEALLAGVDLRNGARRSVIERYSPEQLALRTVRAIERIPVGPSKARKSCAS